VLQQLSLDDTTSALSRFRREVAESQQKSTGDLQKQVQTVVKEFSLDEENSALSRLVQNVDRAQSRITREFSLDDDASSLSRLRRQLVEMLEKQRTDNQQFQLEVTKALAEMKAQDQEKPVNAVKEGFVFEERVIQAVEGFSQGNGDIVLATGATTGRKRNCKVGDATVELGAESAAPGARIVLECKQANYTLAKALEEIEVGKQNRDADVGIFVWSAQSAPDSQEPLARYGDNIVVVWDGTDAGDDLLLKVSLSLARALCVRRAAGVDKEVDFGQLDRVLLEVERQVGHLDSIEKWAGTIKSNAQKITDRVEKMRRALAKELDRLRDVTTKLK